MATYFPTQNGRIKIQAETLLGTDPTGGWVYQAPGTGNNAAGAQGGYYYFKSETLDGSVKSATQGLFGATIYVAEAGLYTLRVRTARDTNDPGDSRNDIWVRIDDHMNSVLPEGSVPIETTASGYAKLKGASTAWGYARTFSALHEEDASPSSQVYLTQGFHTISFAGRSVGLHIDFFELFRNGLNVGVNAAETPAVDGPVLPSAGLVDEDASVVLDVLAGLGSGYAVTGATDPAKGTATVNPDGTIRYTPDADFFGTDTFVFSVRDSLGVVTTQRMTMTVAGTPDRPDAAADGAATVKGTAVAIAVLANDGDRDGTSVAINAFDGTSAAGGTVTKVGSQLVYTPPAGFTGTDTFTYDVIDPTGRVSERASVAVAVADGPTGGLPIVVGVYDADSDTLVDLLADGDVLDAALLDGTATFAVSVVAGSALDGRVGSARLTLSGDATATRTESGAPYSLFGDKDGDYAGTAIGTGDYRLKVELFAKAGGKGALLDSFDFDFGVAEAPAPAPLRVGLYDADTDTLVDVIEDGDVLSAALLDGAMTFAVSAVEGGALDGRIGSVKLRLSGDATASRTETGAPYSLFGDKDGDLKGGGALAAGAYTFEVDVYSGAGGKGTLLDSFDYAFTVTDPLLL